jgi:uncharacterized membrane protein
VAGHKSAHGRLTKAHPEDPRSVISESFTAVQGPVPSAAEVKLWAEEVPSAPERFLQLVERDQSHIHDVEKEALANQHSYITKTLRRFDRGQIFGMFLSTCLLGVAIYCVNMGLQIAAGVAIAAAVGPVTLSLISSRNEQNRERSDSEEKHS